MRVFKFGGASVKDAESVKNVGEIIREYSQDDLIVVVSAMGKTTNALEQIMQLYAKQDKSALENQIFDLKNFHFTIINELFEKQNLPVFDKVNNLFQTLSNYCSTNFVGDYDFHYDQIISLGEILSTTIIAEYLKSQSFNATWLDARKTVRTDNRWREGRVNWEVTEVLIQTAVEKAIKNETNIIITQGFLGHTPKGETTTLGREGSDFTASIFAYCLDANDVTIWKDVPGMLNADPKYFDNTELLEKISFREAIELAYFGASVIHPKTIQPLKRKRIPLHIKSFIHPSEQGSVIQESIEYDDHIPSFIFKLDQVLVSLTPKDFSFIVEENLEHIFAYLNQQKIRINLMQNSAVSFSFIVDQSRINLEALVAYFQDDYAVKYNQGLELVTIRHYDEPTINRVTVGKKIILEQRSRQTARLVIG
ncbi:aspartate kinase [Crocinitomix algicola]|uniref:aspartate kinase n=1 Tax=Crocinitomix algicola TaxID=1740263 RepID=UPI00082EB1F2|nr:aspartate kinase [Crocinitomix algicola]